VAGGILPEDSTHAAAPVEHHTPQVKSRFEGLVWLLIKVIVPRDEYFLKALKIKSVLSVYALMVFKFFGIFNVLKSTSKIPSCFFQNLTNSRYFTGSRIRILSPTPHRPTPTKLATQRKLRASFQSLKLPTINNPPLMKSNTVTRLKIISGLRNNVQYQRRLPVCRNQQFEEGYWKDF